jgi:hypothetical protein
MTSKPPYGMAASGHSDADPDLEDLSDQIDVDPSQDVTVEASEEATLEVAEEESGDGRTSEFDDDHVINTLTPPPMSAQTPPPRRAPTLMGLPLPSLPLPGVTAATPPSTDEDITVMARPSVTDDEEEATKVEPAETALHAAASKDDDEVTTALSAQASVERERALRKSLPPLDMPLSAHGYGSDDSAEFEDPEDDDGIKLSTETPGAIAVDDDAIATSSYSADAEEPSSELEAVLAPRRPTAALGSLGSLGGSLGGPLGSNSPFGGSPVLARPDAFGAARLPTPSPGFGISIPSPTQAPAPTNSPFSARLAPIGSPYGARATSSAPMPALQIPAPSGAAATTATDGDFGFFSPVRPVRLPLGAVLMVPVAVFLFGLYVGAKHLGNRLSVLTVATLPAPAPTPIVIQPVAPTMPATAAATPPPTAAAPTPPPGAAVPTPAPAAAAAVAEETPPPAAKPAAKPAVKRAARPVAHKVASIDDIPMAKPAPAPKPAAAPKAKPVKAAKAAKGWVDPFAE